MKVTTAVIAPVARKITVTVADLTEEEAQGFMEYITSAGLWENYGRATERVLDAVCVALGGALREKPNV